MKENVLQKKIYIIQYLCQDVSFGIIYKRMNDSSFCYLATQACYCQDLSKIPKVERSML